MEYIEYNDWDLLPNGNIDSEALEGFYVAALPYHVLVRLEIRQRDGRLAGAQIHIPDDKAHDLALAILAKVEQARGKPPS